MKKIIAIAMAFVLFFPTISASAVEGGIFHGVTLNSINGTPVTWATDGNLNTAGNIRYGPNPIYELDEPTTISKYILIGGGCITFYSDIERKKKIHQIGLHDGSGEWESIHVEGVRSIDVNTCGVVRNVYLKELDFKSYTPINYSPVTSVKTEAGHNSIKIDWTNPDETEFKNALVKFNGRVIEATGNSYTIENLEPETRYTFKISAMYTDGKTSIEQSINATTKKEPPPLESVPDISGLNALAQYDRVDLTWNLPKTEKLKNVNIYRYEVQQTALIDQLSMIKTASAAPTGKKIFETNGTYFNDLTVDPETTYQYTVTTTSADLIESAGVSKTVTTPAKPAPEIVGGEMEKDPVTGSYIFKWTEPTTGKVKIMVGGKLYKTVNASVKTVVIPAEDMKYKGLDEPDVYLIPVDEDGKEGSAVKPPTAGGGTGGMLDDVDLPFTAGELLGTGTGLFWLIGPFVLLALAFLIFPKLRHLIVRAFTGKKDDEENGRRFRRSESDRVREERIRVAREREASIAREPAERVQRAERAPRERVHKTRMTRAERRTTE